MNYESVRKLIKACGCVFALTIGIGVPLAFGILDYLRLHDRSRSEAEFHANTLSRLTEIGALKLFTSADLKRILPTISGASSNNSRVRILSEDSTPLVEWGATHSGRSLIVGAPVTLRGELLGRVQVETPLTEFVATVVPLSILAIVLGCVTYFAISAIPLQALEEASREVSTNRASLEDKNRQLDAALSNMVQGLCLYDAEQRIVVANERYADIYNLPHDVIRPKTTLREVLEARVSNASYNEHEARDVIEQGLAKFGDYVSEIVTLRDGRHISVVRRPLPGGGLISTHEDVTDRKKADAMIAHMAMHDALTGLPNRTLLKDRLDKTLPRASEGNMVALHCIDLDRFKAVNDTLGHPMGDKLLQSVAERLQSCIRGNDLVTRLGGDEFAILQTAVTEGGQSAALASRVIAALSEPFLLDGHRVTIGASIGIAVAPADGSDGVELLKNADLALYCSKSEGRGRFHFFEKDMDARIQARRQLELDLHSALALGQLELHYQPLIDLKSESVVAMEALLRWKHPTRGNIPPMDFIPIMEEIGLIHDVGIWVMREACREAKTWPDGIGVSINVSAHQFKSASLALEVAAALANSGLSPDRLELEITETALMQDTQATLDALRNIRTLGVKIAMDDFGTGYSSLSYLHAFPFDKIKIDKCFVQSLSEKPESAHILKAVVGLGTNLHMVTTAEGVETLAQLERLREDGCAQVQGYYFSPPRPAHELPAIFRRLNPPAALAS